MKRTLQVLYSLILVLLVLASLALTSQNLGAGIMMATFGIAFPLFFIPTLIPYLASFAPLVYRVMEPLRAFVLAVILIAVIGVGPGMASRLFASRWASQSGSPSALVDIHGQARTIELANPFSYRIDGQYVPDWYCNGVCRKLLLTGQVDWVRVSQSIGLWTEPRLRRQMRAYRVGKAAECFHVTPSGSDSCVVAAAVGDEPADLTVAINIQTVGDFTKEAELAQLVYKIDYTASWQQRVVYDNVGLEAMVLARPTLIHARDGGFSLQRITTNINGVDLTSVFRELGYKL
jgi:hypothetical protein